MTFSRGLPWAICAGLGEHHGICGMRSCVSKGPPFLLLLGGMWHAVIRIPSYFRPHCLWCAIIAAFVSGETLVNP